MNVMPEEKREHVEKRHL